MAYSVEQRTQHNTAPTSRGIAQNSHGSSSHLIPLTLYYSKKKKNPQTLYGTINFNLLREMHQSDHSEFVVIIDKAIKGMDYY